MSLGVSTWWYLPSTRVTLTSTIGTRPPRFGHVVDDPPSARKPGKFCGIAPPKILSSRRILARAGGTNFDRANSVLAGPPDCLTCRPSAAVAEKVSRYATRGVWWSPRRRTCALASPRHVEVHVAKAGDNQLMGLSTRSRATSGPLRSIGQAMRSAPSSPRAFGA